MSTQELDTSTITINVRHPRTQYSDKEREFLRSKLAIALRWLDSFSSAVHNDHVPVEPFLNKLSFDRFADAFSFTALGTSGLFAINGMNISCGEATIGPFQMGFRDGSTYTIIRNLKSNLGRPNIALVPVRLSMDALIKAKLIPTNETIYSHELLAKYLLTFYICRAVHSANLPGGPGVYVSSFLNSYKFYFDYLQYLNIYVTELEFNNPNTGNPMTQVVWESRDFILKLLQNEMDLERFFFDTASYIKELQGSTRAIAAVKSN